MTYYLGLVDRGGEGYGIWFPDLPGCCSGGRTIDDLFANAIEALALWVEDARADGETIQVPRGIDELRRDPAVREALALDQEISFLQVPLLIEKGRSRTANISLDVGLLEAIDAAAKQRGLTRSAFLASAAKAKIMGS